MQAKIWNNSTWIKETNPHKLRVMFGRMLEDAGFNVLDVLEHYFKPQGYTALYLLSESHFAVHTFPDSARHTLSYQAATWSITSDLLNLQKICNYDNRGTEQKAAPKNRAA